MVVALGGIDAALEASEDVAVIGLVYSTSRVRRARATASDRECTCSFS